MASPVVYAAVMAASLASLRAVRTRLVVFDTSVVDLTEQLADPVEVPFATQLGGGTDINSAVSYGQSLVTRPADTIMVLISDLLEGGDQTALLRRVAALTSSGVRLIVLLALSDDGAPAYDHQLAAACIIWEAFPIWESFPQYSGKLSQIMENQAPALRISVSSKMASTDVTDLTASGAGGFGVGISDASTGR